MRNLFLIFHIFLKTVSVASVARVRAHILNATEDTLRSTIQRREYVKIKADVFPVHVFVSEHGYFDDRTNRMLVVQSGHVKVRLVLFCMFVCFFVFF